MPHPPKSRISQDYLLETLHAETLAGTENLTAWLNHIAAQKGTDTLFELEAWLRGLRAFFEVRHLPLSEAERSDLVNRTFAPEIRIVHETIQHIERSCNTVLRFGQPQKLKFESFIESQMRKGGTMDYQAARVLEQPTPLDSMAHFLEALTDLRALVHSLRESESQSYPVFLSIGRIFYRDLRSCRYIDMLLTQRFKAQFDQVDNAVIASLLRSIQEEQVRRNISLTLLHLYRMLRYLKVVSARLIKDRPLRHCLVIFSLLHEEMSALSQFLKARFLRGKQAGQSLWNAAELIVFSLSMESLRALQRELVFVSREREAPPIYSKIESSHGLLRNCYQNCILALAQAIDPSIDTKLIFPSMVDRLQEAQKLLQALWTLRQAIKSALEQKEEIELHKIMERLTLFRESSLRYLMYRDWGEFEEFSDAIVIAMNQIELRTLLRKFMAFLETLIREVSKRSVLKESTTEQTLKL